MYTRSDHAAYYRQPSSTLKHPSISTRVSRHTSLQGFAVAIVIIAAAATLSTVQPIPRANCYQLNQDTHVTYVNECR